MELQDRLIILFDYYGELLTDSQKNYFIDYYFHNLTLSEIAENNSVSKNAVSKDLKLACSKLEDFDSKLKLIDKDKKIIKVIKEENNEELVGSSKNHKYVFSFRPLSRQEHWNGWPGPAPGDLHPRIKPKTPADPALETDSLPLSHRGSPISVLSASFL